MIRPSYEQSQLDYFTTRLEDASQLDQAVWLTDGQLAVPVAINRQGGFICADGKRDAMRAIAILAEHPGFPDLRYVPGAASKVMDNVRWGADLPACPSLLADDQEWANWEVRCGRFYGYSKAAIRTFVREHYGP